MALFTHDHYLFVPGAPGDNSGHLYHLAPSERFQKNSFVLIPYANPQVKLPEIKFYSVLEKIYIADATVYSKPGSSTGFEFKPFTTKPQYLEHVTRIKAEIQQGNIYEINYCLKFFAQARDIDPLDIFLQLNALAKAPYSCLLKTGDTFIICASPELFLKRTVGSMSTKPIKGTIRRGNTKTEDEALRAELQQNIKERTENVMAVDVARNDFSRFAKKGTVEVNRLYNIETFETVHQMVSTVTCEIKDELLNLPAENLFKRIIGDTFPMASMTGAPKLRAMQLIDEHEDFDRQYYSGAMGLVDGDEDFVLPVIIRSIFYDQQNKQLWFAVGGAITYLSEPEKEYEECLLKAAALLKVLKATIA